MSDPKLEKKMDKRSQLHARRGLSINETIAADANLSVGSRGVDVSGVKSGAGAGAGSTSITPGTQGASPAPEIVPDARTTGTTPRGDSAITANQNSEPDLSDNPTSDEIAARAYRCWHERGCPDGSPDIDWTRAEQELRTERQGKSAAAGAR